MYKNSVMNIRSIDRNVVNCEVWVFVMKKGQNGIYEQSSSVIDKFDKEIELSDEQMEKLGGFCNDRLREECLTKLINK